MTREGWMLAILEAVERAKSGDDELLNLMATLLREQDQSKHELRELGFGCMGMPWLDMVQEIRDYKNGHD